MRGTIVALLALAVGLGVGYLLGASKEAGATARAAPAAQAAREPPDLRAAGDCPLARALRELPAPPVERGNGTVSGRVTRPDGTPVPGVTVSAAMSPTPIDGAPGDIEDAVRRFVSGLQRQQRSRVEALTDPDGAYVLSGLAAVHHSLSARLPGFRISPPRGTEASQVMPGATLDFTAEPVVDVTFDVRLPDGSPAPDATVTLRAGDEASPLPWRRDEPRVAVPPGRYVCTAERLDHDQRSAKVPLDVDEGACPPTVALRLEGRTGIKGSITFARDLPFRYASVHAIAFTGERPPERELLVERGDETWWRSGDRRYALDLARGRYLVGVSLMRRIVATRIVEVSQGMATCDFSIDAIDPSLYVAVRVLDPEGKPVFGDLSFDVEYRSEARSSSSSATDAMPRPDGSYLVFSIDTSGDQGGIHSVTVRSARYGERKVEYKARHTKEVVVRFADVATLDLVIAGFASSEFAPNVSVGLVPYPFDHDDWFSISMSDGARQPDAEGRLALGPVAAGEHELVVCVRAGRPEGEMIATTRRVTLAAGRNTLSLPMPRLSSLVVADPERKPGRTFRLALETGRGWSEMRDQTDDDGRVRFAPLPDGRYQLAREDDDSGAMRVLVPGPAEVAFKPAPHDSLRITVTAADGPWTRAGFMDGDLVVAVDGDELKSLEDLHRAYATLTEKEPVRLTVLRGGGRIELSVNAKTLFEGGAVDGGIQWATR